MRILWASKQKADPKDLYSEFVEVYAELRQLRSKLAEVQAGQGVTLGAILATRQSRLDRVTLTAGSNTVTFSSPLPVPYVLIVQARDSSNVNMEVEVSGKTISGFTARVFAACTLDYVAIEE